MAAGMLSVNATVYRGLPEPSESKQQNAHLNRFLLLSGEYIQTETPRQHKSLYSHVTSIQEINPGSSNHSGVCSYSSKLVLQRITEVK